MFKRRTQNLIDFEVQSSLLLRLCIHWIVFLVATAFAMFMWIRLFDSPVYSWEETTTRFRDTFVPLLIVALALFPVFLLDSIKLSNRFTGPIFRLRRTLASLANGTPTQPLEFRSSDFWKSLAKDFNHVVSISRTEENKPAELPTAEKT